MASSKGLQLGSYTLEHTFFPHLEKEIAELTKEKFKALTSRQKFRFVNEQLLKLIQSAPDHSFLLAAILEYIERVNQEGIFSEHYRFSLFEFWLNRFSTLSEEERFHIRCKIVGKCIPREAYQLFFPVGMNRQFYGSHFVAAHLSPDIDTTIASFFGWVDAFAAKIGTGQHIWCLPGGPPDSHVTLFFRELFGPWIFRYLARQTQTLSLTAIDLLTQHKMEKLTHEKSTLTIDHGNNDKAIVYVDEKGHYLGDWRASDVEQVRQVTNLFKGCLHWFENDFHLSLISLFSKAQLKSKDLDPFFHTIFDKKVGTADPVQEYTEEQKKNLNSLLCHVLHLENGLESTFLELLKGLGALGVEEGPRFHTEVLKLQNSGLFDKSGSLNENRPQIFHQLESIFSTLDLFVQQARAFVEKLGVVMRVKELVLGHIPQLIFLKSDVEEIRAKMRHYDYLTVVIPEEKGHYFPVGIVRSADLRREALGTVSLRDFSNFSEMKMASYLQVISIIDHHKIDIKTNSQPQIIVGDAQSCNVLVAELTFKLNDQYSMGGMTLDEIESQIDKIKTSETSDSAMRRLKRLLNKRAAAKQAKFWVTPQREYSEYLSFLYAILDDTDLLSKVSARDVECVAEILNRLKSLSQKKEVEIVDLSDIPRDDKFAHKAAARLLRNDEMYSIYKKVYEYKEREVEANILLLTQGLPSNTFADTKEQNGCCLVGQTKIFPSNYKVFDQNQWALRNLWLKNAEERSKGNLDIDLCMHMISTIPSADDVHSDSKALHAHQDEIWLWIKPTPQGEMHLSRFLSLFQNSPEVQDNEFEVSFYGPNASLYDQIFTRNFIPIPKKDLSNEILSPLPIAVLRFKPGTLNSRKSMITPYLPRLVS